LEAPGLFSITTGCPMDAVSLSPSSRAITSMAPPGVAGTTILIDRVG